MYGNPDEPNGLFWGAASGPGNPCHRNPDIGSRSLANTGRHLKRHFLAHRAVALQVLSSDAEQMLLHVIVVRYYTPEEYIAGSGDAGEPLAQHSARAALGHGELELQSATPVEDNRGEIGVILSVCVRFYSAPQFHHCFFYELQGARRRHSLRRDAQVDSSNARQIGERERSELRVRVAKEVRAQQFGDR